MQFRHVTPQEPLDTLRINEQQWRHMLTEFEYRKTQSKTNRRRHQRVAMVRTPNIAITVTHPGGTMSDYLAWSKDLSSSGIGLLHGTYLYENSPIIVHLRSHHTGIVQVRGRVTNCSLLKGRTHMVGVQFDEELKVEPFLFKDNSGIMGSLLSMADDESDPAAA